MNFISNSLLLLLLCVVHSNAQIGIGTDNPNENVILDISSQDRGILIPRISDLENVKKTQYSLVFNEVDRKFYFFNDNKWQCINSFLDYEDSLVIKTKKQILVENLLKANSIQANQITVQTKVQANEFVGNGTIPLGGIIMWSGSISTIPKGFTLCDGDIVNGIKTPDLQGRFVVSYDSASSNYNSLNLKGGNSSLYLSSNELPYHRHFVDQDAHSHSLRYNNHVEMPFNMVFNDADYMVSVKATLFTKDEDSESSYFPYSSKYKVGLFSTKINIKVNDDNQARGNPIDIRPPYYVLAYIMRVY